MLNNFFTGDKLVSDRKIFTFLLMLFLCSSLIKNTLSVFYIFPVDFSLICILLLVFYISFFYKSVSFSNFEQYFLFFYFLFSFFYLISYFYSPSYLNAQAKIIGIFLSFFSIVVTFVFKVNFKLFIYILLSISITCFFITNYLNFFYFDLYDLDSLKGSYLSISLFLGYCSILTFFCKKYFLCFFILSLILFSGARGPLIFSVISMLIMVFISGFIQMKVKILSKFLFSVFLVIFIFTFLYLSFPELSEQVDRSISRFSLLFEEDKGRSVDKRIELIDVAFNMWNSNPLFGSGLGSFPVYLNGSDFRAYPHNVFVEIFSETGFISGLIFLFLFLLLIFDSFKHRNYVQFAVILYCLMNISKSYGFEDIRFVFMFILILRSLPKDTSV